jgi:hypothetical protein
VGGWIKTSAAASFIFANDVINSGDYSGWALDTSAGNPRFTSFWNNGHPDSTNVTGATSVNDGVWHFVVGTYDTTSLRIYVDGASDANAVASAAPSYDATETVYVGGASIILDDAFLFKGKALSAAEILALYKENPSGAFLLNMI